MNNRVQILFFILLFSVNLSAQDLRYPNHKCNLLDINRIILNVNNYGSAYARNRGCFLQGAYWGNIDVFTDNIIYDHGLWIVGKIDNDIRWSLVQWTSSYSPGPIIDEQAAMLVNPEDSLKYRVYKISKDDSTTVNPDINEWPTDLGAPTGENGFPVIYNDQMTWAVYNTGNDSIASYFPWFFDTLKTFPVEIHQIIHAKKSLDSTDIFANIVFLEWTIINKGSQPVDSTFIGFWTDIDSYSWCETAYIDFPGIDKTNQLGYCWTKGYPCANGNKTIGYVLLYGPAVPSSGDTAVFKGYNKDDFKNLSLTAFRGIYDDSNFQTELGYLVGEVRSRRGAWNAAQGYNTEGSVIIDIITGEPTKFPFSGDPVTGEGWTYDKYPDVTSGGAGFVMFSGPFNLAPQDTQWVMIALIPAIGETYGESITKLREYASYLRSLNYEQLVTKSVYEPLQTPLPKEFQLYHNYPNPFNAVTIIKYSLPVGSFVTLKVYDILGREIATLVNEEKPAGSYEVEFKSTVGSLPSGQAGLQLASGIYFYRLQ
ncbi:MAG: T9SS type A sorting domain-containing protein, partial [Ignavibacteriaceae bacterium]|nr:T9SS type A sorting domain-containing protein [Ignavibacteriaceae bacterium]